MAMTLWPWLCRHAAWSHNRFHVKLDHKCARADTEGRLFLLPRHAVLFMEPMPAHRRKRGGWRHQKMDAGTWLGRAEESDEHLVPRTAGVYRCRTIRRLLRSDRELLPGLKGVPRDVTAGALPRAKPEKITMRLAVPAPEVIRKGDGLETPGEALDNGQESDKYAPTTPENQEAQEEVTEPPQRPGEGHGGSSQPALTAPASPGRRPVVRGSEGPDSPTKSVMQPIIWIETVDRMKSLGQLEHHRRSAS